MSRLVLLAIVAACGAPPAPAPVSPPPPPPPAPPVDAAPAADAPPEAVETADPWVFRYATAARTETWTLRELDDRASLVVETAQGTLHYKGTAKWDGSRILIDVATPSARITLDCKSVQRRLSATCNDPRAPKVDVLDCYVPGFAQPMPFARAPGVEYAVDATCSGYRLRAP